ncbi:hypothetical protein, partial [Streptomyces sp. NPDC054834]
TGDGVSTYLALIFGTLLSSQGTVASFVLTRENLSRLSSGRFPSVLRFRLYQILSASDSLSAGFAAGLLAFARRPFDIHYVSRFPRELIIEFRGFEFGHADTPKTSPAEGSRK